MIRTTDIKISDNLYVARQLVTTKSKKLKGETIRASQIIYKSLPKYRKYLDFPEDIRIRICKIKQRYTAGRYWVGDNIVEIEPNLPWFMVMEILAHELVHAEQYHTGRLKKVFHDRKGWIHHWNGDSNYSKGSTYNAYRSQPWEVEAFDRQQKIAEQVSNDMEEEYNANQ